MAAFCWQSVERVCGDCMVIQAGKRSCSLTPSWFVAIVSFLDDLGSRGPGTSGGTIPGRQGRET